VDPASSVLCYRMSKLGVGACRGLARLDKDAQGKTIEVRSAEIDRVAPQSRSLMQDLLLRDLTAQKVADLLEFLASLR
jgi:hypothetical protein